jgi:predicted enzyme related to lactoylglutathione lyase
MKITLASIFVDDQDKALKFYTEVLGFRKKQDFPIGGAKWLTVVSPEGSEDIELLLEPNGNSAAKTYQEEIYKQGIPATSFLVEDIDKEYERLSSLGVEFLAKPTKADWGSYAIFDDTCGNLINLHQPLVTPEAES